MQADEGAVRQVDPMQPVQTPAMGSANDPFAVKLSVHLGGGWDLHAEALSKGGAIRVVTGTPALRARPVPCGERHRLVVEEQIRVAVWLPLRTPTAPKLERAGDPEIACVKADDVVADVKDAAVARPCAPERNRLDVACGRHTIAGRRHGLRFSRRAAGRL